MTTNIRFLSQMSASYHIVRNADWVDQIDFVYPNTTTPIDLTGIDFYCQMRPTEDDPIILIDMSTRPGNGLLLNGGPSGILSWRVPWRMMKLIKGVSAVLDILAVADDYKINLFQEAGPASVVIHSGATIVEVP